MMQPQLITPELVALDVDFGSTPREVIEHLAGGCLLYTSPSPRDS